MNFLGKIKKSLKLAQCLSEATHWKETGDPQRPLTTTVHQQVWKLEVNDFPEQAAYSLYINDKFVGSFNSWPERWVTATNSVPVAVGTIR